MTKKVITKLWGINAVPVSTTGSLDETLTYGSFSTNAIEPAVVTLLWFPKES